LYALGSILYLLLMGKIFDPGQPIAIEKLRPNVPAEVRTLIKLLLSNEPNVRPSGRAVWAQLSSALLLRYGSKKPITLASAKAA
jgi:hypothetical protein